MVNRQFSPSYQTDSTPGVSPYAATSHSRHGGVGKRSITRTTLGVTAPLLLFGLVAAILAGSNTSTTYQSTTNSDVSPAVANATIPSNLTLDTTSAQPVTGGTNLQVSASVSSPAGNGNSGTQTQVTINGQPVAVPANGTVNKTITNSDGSSSSFSISTSTQGDSSNFSSTDLNVSSSTSSDSSGFSDTNGQATVWSTP